jgi:hypothetical protein
MKTVSDYAFGRNPRVDSATSIVYLSLESISLGGLLRNRWCIANSYSFDSPAVTVSKGIHSSDFNCCSDSLLPFRRVTDAENSDLPSSSASFRHNRQRLCWNQHQIWNQHQKLSRPVCLPIAFSDFHFCTKKPYTPSGFSWKMKTVKTWIYSLFLLLLHVSNIFWVFLCCFTHSRSLFVHIQISMKPEGVYGFLVQKWKSLKAIGRQTELLSFLRWFQIWCWFQQKRSRLWPKTLNSGSKSLFLASESRLSCNELSEQHFQSLECIPSYTVAAGLSNE